MKKLKSIILPFTVIVSIALAIGIGTQSCKKTRCYDCERYDANNQPYGQVTVCSEDDKNALEAQHYKCDYNGKHKKH